MIVLLQPSNRCNRTALMGSYPGRNVFKHIFGWHFRPGLVTARSGNALSCDDCDPSRTRRSPPDRRQRHQHVLSGSRSAGRIRGRAGPAPMATRGRCPHLRRRTPATGHPPGRGGAAGSGLPGACLPVTGQSSPASIASLTSWACATWPAVYPMNSAAAPTRTATAATHSSP